MSVFEGAADRDLCQDGDEEDVENIDSRNIGF